MVFQADTLTVDILGIDSLKEAENIKLSPWLKNDSLGLSATLPRISPDGRFLMFTLGRYGCFHIWHNAVGGCPELSSRGSLLAR